MVTKVIIQDNTKSPLRYIADLKAFNNGREYVFQPGVNIIVGENGCGKTTQKYGRSVWSGIKLAFRPLECNYGRARLLS